MKNRKNDTAAMKVVVLDGYTVTKDDLSWEALANGEGWELVVHDRTRPEEVVERCQEAEAVLTNKVILTEETLAALPRLRYIGVLATGYNVVDCAAARRRGIVVTNIPAYSTASVAQQVFAHLLNVTNHVAHYASLRERWVDAPDFTWSDTPLTELADKTLGIYGLGAIGTAVARVGVAFGMKVLAVTSREAEALPAGIEKANWREVLERADVLSLHCPLTPETHHLIDGQALLRMKPSAILVNTGRGPLVDEEAVAVALWEQCLAAYCADVLAEEPPRPDNPLLTAPRCYITPHIAWATREARQRLVLTAARNLQAFAAGKPINVVN